jgi:putative oxidoreductase
MKDGWRDLAPLPLRLMLGFGFIYHGFPKLFDSEERGMFFGMLQEIGVPLPEVTGWIVALVEFFGGIALVLGAGVLIFGVLLVINMLVALITVHLPHGFSFLNIVGVENGEPVMGMPGYEVNLLYIAGLLALLLGGAGAASVDRMLARKKRSTRG